MPTDCCLKSFQTNISCIFGSIPFLVYELHPLKGIERRAGIQTPGAAEPRRIPKDTHVPLMDGDTVAIPMKVHPGSENLRKLMIVRFDNNRAGKHTTSRDVVDESAGQRLPTPSPPRRASPPPPRRGSPPRRVNDHGGSDGCIYRTLPVRSGLARLIKLGG